jgi:hypothetical protein
MVMAIDLFQSCPGLHDLYARASEYYRKRSVRGKIAVVRDMPEISSEQNILFMLTVIGGRVQDHCPEIFAEVEKSCVALNLGKRDWSDFPAIWKEIEPIIISALDSSPIAWRTL